MDLKNKLKDMIGRMNQEEAIDFILAEVDVLAGQIDAHRFVMAWIIHQQSFGDQGAAYLSGLANLLDNEDRKNDHHQAVVDEIDELRALVASLRERQQHGAGHLE